MAWPRCYSTAASSAEKTAAAAAEPKPEAGAEKPQALTEEMKKRQKVYLNYNAGQTRKERLRVIVRDYGRTVIVFHIGISLMSLGAFYTIVSSGLDLTPAILLITTGSSEPGAEPNELVTKIMSEGSTFLVAYAVHKLFAPVRLSLTFGLAPIIVRYLRKKGILKPPKDLAG